MKGELLFHILAGKRFILTERTKVNTRRKNAGQVLGLWDANDCLRTRTGHARDIAGAQVRLNNGDDSEEPRKELLEAFQGTIPRNKQGSGFCSIGSFCNLIMCVCLHQV